MVETALVLPLLILFLLLTIIGGMMVFNYQQTALLAREGARYAAVHGANYAAATGKSAATAEDVYNQAILPLATGLDATKLTYSVIWSDSNKAPVVADPMSDPPGQPVATLVTVTVDYETTYFGIAMKLSSTSVMPMAY